ncbi:unnamed protein product [Fraxinus pennsylvanica]|uniref:Uncharacterized protein n=1 Tax=Fraxinus pennsylvanica TaxID=56036 RepID=A0AAD2E6G9_9LAMI|nr:unnamed protein product [Fraxinus pennsylvanica]
MSFHVRSNSSPSKSHPEIANVEDHICRLRSSEEASFSASSICTQMASLRDSHEVINNLIQLPSIQQTLMDQANELIDGSLELIDICGIARDVILLMKESVEELESSLRRNRGIDTYVNSRKKIEKMVKKCIKNLKTFDQCSTLFLNKDNNLKAVASMLKEALAIGFSVLKSTLSIFASKQKAWSLVSMFSRLSRVHSHIEEELYALNINKLRKDMDTLSVQTTPRILALVKKEPPVVKHHEGKLLKGSVNINLIWYGKFTSTQRSIILEFSQSLSHKHHCGSPPLSVASWWSTAAKYKGGLCIINVGNQVFDQSYSLGKSLKDAQIVALASKTSGHVNGVNVVLMAFDVAVEDFCLNKCGSHGYIRGKSRKKNWPEDIDNLIQLPSAQQSLRENKASELFDGSLKLVDMCGIVRDVVVLMKKSVQELQSEER